mmetsp:Transcript_119209/g.229958  ORF Transcript_119209/g.229958 Transcript_119209/m.229958 type:complete len:866 (-) Transcript_119209:131-2728(-)
MEEQGPQDWTPADVVPAAAPEERQRLRASRAAGRERHIREQRPRERSRGSPPAAQRGSLAGRREGSRLESRGPKARSASRARETPGTAGLQSAGSRRPRYSRGEANSLHETPPHRQEPQDLEEKWQHYLRSEEYLTFQAVVESLRVLPEMSQLADRRADFELLLHLLHRLGRALEIEHVSKNYRAHYSPDVQLSGYLYSTLLTAFTLLPSYVLNGQEFYVSDTVLDQCQSLQFVFQETCRELRKQFENLQAYSLEHIRNDVKRSLIYFDRSWCRFEMPALEEIEAIHRQACRPLIDAIEAEQALLDCEAKVSAVTRGSTSSGTHRVRLEVQRNRLIEKLCELNRLANVDGKGRADMDLTCVLEAERIVAKPMCMHLRVDAGHEMPGMESCALAGPICVQPHRCNGCASPVLLRIARSLLRSLARIRRILQRYARCLYQLNSHLANNPDLVRSLELFESAWETANRYLVQAAPRRLALLAYDIVSNIHDPDFEAALSSLDPGFLVASLPRALLLHEMRRYAAAKAAALMQTGRTPAAAQAAAKSQAAMKPPLMGSSTAPALALPKIALPSAGGAAGSMLPRPLDMRRVPSSAFQHSPISRAFLPQDVAETYNETAAVLECLSAAKLVKVCSILVSPAGGSTGSTPMTRSTPLQQASQPPKSAGPRLKSAEAPPRTPCPPRMAVPNASRPTSAGRSPRAGGPGGACNVELLPTAAAEEESDDEEEAFTINLAGLQSSDGAEESIADSFAGSLAAAPAPSSAAGEGPGGGASSDFRIRRVVSAVSTLALHLQRTKAHEWNELIQVVLQGFMLVKSARSAANPTANAAPSLVVTGTAAGAPAPAGLAGGATGQMSGERLPAAAAATEVW